MVDTRKFSISFELCSDRLEVRHNGIPFDENDVRGICGIVEAADKGLAQIGKFGIGFKSVYAYTNSPEIYSGDKSFYIKDYVHPYPEEPGKDLLYDKIREENIGKYGTQVSVYGPVLLANLYSDRTHFIYELLQNAEDACERANKQGQTRAEETLFIIRFNSKVETQVAYLEIEKRLRNLGLRTLLFLENIQEISYKIGSATGKYLRSSKIENGTKRVFLYFVEKDFEKQSEKWLIFEKPLSRDKNRKLEIAYQLVYDNNSKKERINPSRDVKLFVYFPTEKETHLRFLIQGPYNTTPARDNIREDAWNRELIAETAALVSESISMIRNLDLLDVAFLDTLPIDIEHFTKENTVFRPIYEKVKEKLSSDEALLPTYDRSFVSAKLAFLARGRDLCSLLSGEQLDSLFKRKNSKWLDENITEDKTPELRQYLIDELGIEEVDPELFARAFNEEFVNKQNDKWIISFYGFLLNQKALWRKATYSYEKSGLLRSKPIIRLNDNSHIVPFDSKGNPVVYLPHKDPGIKKLFTRVVKETLVFDKRANEFLKELGLNEPDKAAGVLDFVLPHYKEMAIVEEKENMQHVEWVFRALEDCAGSRKDNLLSALKDTPFLYAVNASSQQKEYRKPAEIHLGEKYTSDKGLEIFFEGNEKIWFLDDRYLALIDIKKMLEKLKEIGCKSGIEVRCRKADFLNHVIIADYWGLHRRGLNGFDPDCEIEELEHVLKSINIEKSRILWHIAKQYGRSVYGEVEYSSRQNYDQSTKEWTYSKMGKLLVDYSWLPHSESSSFHKPSEIMLSELPDDFGKESPEAKYVSEKLGFKPEVDQRLQELLQKTPDKAKEILEIFMSSSTEVQQRILENARAIRSSENVVQGTELADNGIAVIEVSPSSSELEDEYRRALSQERPSSVSIEDKTWAGPTPEEEKKMHESSVKILDELSKRHQRIKIGIKEVSYKETEGKGEVSLRAFLLEQYKGHCQVCNAKLDLGSNKDPYFEIYRLIEKRRLYGAWSDQEFNVLCLCPNCHALMKYGGRDLNRIFDKAEKVAKGEEVPEEVSERRGDFYIIPITIADKRDEIFITPFHMAKISAFIKWLKT